LESQREVFGAAAGPMLATTPGGAAKLRALVDPRLHDLLDRAAPTSGATIWSTRVQVNFGDRTTAVDAYVAPVHDAEGRWVGGTTIAKPGVRGAILSTLALGDVALFDRMVPLMRPARRPSAVLLGWPLGIARGGATDESATGSRAYRSPEWLKWDDPGRGNALADVDASGSLRLRQRDDAKWGRAEPGLVGGSVEA
jgi:hypothetical protein